MLKDKDMSVWLKYFLGLDTNFTLILHFISSSKPATGFFFNSTAVSINYHIC